MIMNVFYHTHIYDLEHILEARNLDPQDVLDLTGEHVHRGPRREAADERVGHVGRHKPDLAKPHDDLKTKTKGNATSCKVDNSET